MIGGVLSFFGALAYAELGAMLPATGGQYVYLREAYGPMCAFVCGWTFMLAVLAGRKRVAGGHLLDLCWATSCLSRPSPAKALVVALIAVLVRGELRGSQGRRVGAAHVHLF